MSDGISSKLQISVHLADRNNYMCTFYTFDNKMCRQKSPISFAVNVTCSVDATDGKPAFHINYKTTNISDVRVIAKYEPLVSDLGYYFSGSVQEQIIINDSTDIVCIVSDARGRYINSRHIAGNALYRYDAGRSGGLSGRTVNVKLIRCLVALVVIVHHHHHHYF